ncbi:hypothetical protein PsorP6_002287 [Peronosclerospora sorghi]|uniref:Uncharacterized protein n=1 Tax=Peronosclerospora sorghi TaxID=230839 RepID=A0ACC0WUI1_9STRA|nr:hypothetical protein PsorP6_002287 [Peronosclerospora sorghi]
MYKPIKSTSTMSDDESISEVTSSLTHESTEIQSAKLKEVENGGEIDWYLNFRRCAFATGF